MANTAWYVFVAVGEYEVVPHYEREGPFFGFTFVVAVWYLFAFGLLCDVDVVKANKNRS